MKNAKNTKTEIKNKVKLNNRNDKAYFNKITQIN